jgi:hypothetical protein
VHPVDTATTALVAARWTRLGDGGWTVGGAGLVVLIAGVAVGRKISGLQ